MKEYFSHDYNARNDQSLVKLRMKLSMEGLGLYWCLIEMLYENNGKIKLDEIETISFELRTDSERIADVLKNYELFKFRQDYFYSESVNKRLKLRKEKSDKARASAVSRWNKDDKTDANALRTQSERNAIKVKKSKVNKSKDIKVAYRDNVLLSEVEYNKLIERDGKLAVNWMLDKLSNYKLANGNKFVSDYGAINSWVRDEYNKQHFSDKPKAQAGA